MQEKTKNRDWVKNAAIIFLAVLLVLTFFSNTIMNRSLPEVATQDVTSGSIVARVRGTGKVTANTNAQVKMEKTRVIRSVLVKVGQQVEPGDVLFTLGEGSSEDIDAAEEKLRQLQTSYNRTAVTMPTHDYSTENRKIGILSDKLAEAESALKVAEQAAKAATPYATQVADVEKQLEKAVKARDEAKKAYDDALNGIGELETLEVEDYVTMNDNHPMFRPMENYLNSNNTTRKMSVQSLDNFQTALIRILVNKNQLDGDLLNDSLYNDRTKLSTQIDRLSGVFYTVIFRNDDNIPLQSSTYSYGSVPIFAAGTPTSSKNTSEYTYEFLRWEDQDTGAKLDVVTGDVTYKAVYSDTPTPVTTPAPQESTTPAIVINTDEITINIPGASPSPAPVTEPEPAAAPSGPEQQGDSAEQGDSVEPSEAEEQQEDLNTIEEPAFSIDASSIETASIEESFSISSVEDIESLALDAEPELDVIETASLASTTEIIEDTNSIDAETATSDVESTDTIEPKSPLTSDPNTDLSARKESVEKALELYDKAESYKYYAEQIVNQKKAIYDTAVAEADKWGLALQTYLDTGTAESAVYKSKKTAYDAALDAYQTAVESLHTKRASDAQTDAGYNVDLADTWQQIEKAKEKLADLTGDQEGQILARVSGTVQSISASPGDTKKKDDVLAVIEAPDMGYNLSFSVTNEQASRLRVGDTATVSNFYWGAEINATLASIQIDQKNPQTNKLLTFDLGGNVTAGTDLTLSVGEKSANYDIIIPSSAIRTDTNGTFVLKVESKSSPLGNRYIARRVPVEVLASDDSNSAVSADLGYGDYVITTSSAPLKNGQLVRLAST